MTLSYRGRAFELGQPSGRRRVVDRWLSETRLVGLGENRLGLVGAHAAAGGDAQLRSELIQVVHTAGRSAADLLVGDGFADTDVHKFNNLARFQAFKRKCE